MRHPVVYSSHTIRKIMNHRIMVAIQHDGVRGVLIERLSAVSYVAKTVSLLWSYIYLSARLPSIAPNLLRNCILLHTQ